MLEKQANLTQFLEFEAARAREEAEFKKIREDEERRRYIDAQRWLDAADAGADQESVASAREEFPDAGEWILGTDQFRTWSDPDFRCSPRQAILWINGIPGAGRVKILVPNSPHLHYPGKTNLRNRAYREDSDRFQNCGRVGKGTKVQNNIFLL